jgi:hypothetical protein
MHVGASPLTSESDADPVEEGRSRRALPGVRELLRRSEAIEWSSVYLAVALVWGVVLILVTPPFQNFDEPAHFYRAWSVATGSIVPDEATQPLLPHNVSMLEYAFPVVPTIERGLPLWRMPAMIRPLVKQRFGDDWIPSASYALAYGPVGYLPQVMAITVLRPLGRSPLLSLYFGRLLNLACSVLLVYFAIRITPFAKPVLFLVALLPMTMMQMASYSPDALLFAGVFLFAALVLKAATSERVSWPVIVGLAGTAILLLTAKPGYAVITLLIFTVRPGQFGSWKRYLGSVSLIILGSFGVMALLLAIQPTSKELAVIMYGPNNGFDAIAQIKGMGGHPFAFVRALGTTLSDRGYAYYKMMIATYAWGNVQSPLAVALLGGGAILAAISIPQRVRLETWRRLVFIGVGVVTALVICLALYVANTRVGAGTIEGLQGRYFTPSAALAFIGLAGFPFGKRWAPALVLIVIVLVLACIAVTTIITFYN